MTPYHYFCETHLQIHESHLLYVGYIGLLEWTLFSFAVDADHAIYPSVAPYMYAPGTKT